jgi:hypothetical protein
VVSKREVQDILLDADETEGLMACKNGATNCSWPACACQVNALGQPAPRRTDFSTWSRGTLESCARHAADENLLPFARDRVAAACAGLAGGRPYSPKARTGVP